MKVFLVVLLCKIADPSACIERVVTDEALMVCLPTTLPGWMADEGYTARGYQLKRWECQIGNRRKVPA